MSDEKKDTDAAALTAERARQIILKRRARFVAAALAGIGAVGCDSSGPGVCLSIVDIEKDAGKPRARDAGPGVCLSIQERDAGGPRVCLSIDAGGPRVCLSAPLPKDAGSSDAGRPPDASGIDAGPQVCLTLLMRPAPADDQEKES